MNSQIEQRCEPADENDAADNHGEQAGDEHGPRGNIQAAVETGTGWLLEALEQSFNRAVEQLRGNHTTDAKQQQAPFGQTAFERDRGGNDQSAEEEVDGETRMPAYAVFDAAKSFTKLVAPAPARPRPRIGRGFGPVGEGRRLLDISKHGGDHSNFMNARRENLIRFARN